ncbi:MAG: membrane protein insertion efficiency factor YidD [Candidatus Korobacteraceae bacterium]|jgi:putative membrane protein insertion efficiency factor
MKWVAIKLIEIYKRWISPGLPTSCRFVPTCSEYAMESLDRHGVVRGSLLALLRIARCNPLGGSGYDPVPAYTLTRTTTERVEGPEQPASRRTRWCQFGARPERYDHYPEHGHAGAANVRRCCSTSN